MNKAEMIEYAVNDLCKGYSVSFEFQDDSNQLSMLCMSIRTIFNCQYMSIGLYDIGMVELMDIEGYGNEELKREEMKKFISDYLASNDFTKDKDCFNIC